MLRFKKDMIKSSVWLNYLQNFMKKFKPTFTNLLEKKTKNNTTATCFKQKVKLFKFLSWIPYCASERVFRKLLYVKNVCTSLTLRCNLKNYPSLTVQQARNQNQCPPHHTSMCCKKGQGKKKNTRKHFNMIIFVFKVISEYFLKLQYQNGR